MIQFATDPLYVLAPFKLGVTIFCAAAAIVSIRALSEAYRLHHTADGLMRDLALAHVRSEFMVAVFQVGMLCLRVWSNYWPANIGSELARDWMFDVVIVTALQLLLAYNVAMNGAMRHNSVWTAGLCKPTLTPVEIVERGQMLRETLDKLRASGISIVNPLPSDPPSDQKQAPP